MYSLSDHKLTRADNSSGSTIEISFLSPVRTTWVVAIKIGKHCLSVDVAIANLPPVLDMKALGPSRESQ